MERKLSKLACSQPVAVPIPSKRRKPNRQTGAGRECKGEQKKDTWKWKSLLVSGVLDSSNLPKFGMMSSSSTAATTAILPDVVDDLFPATQEGEVEKRMKETREDTVKVIRLVLSK